MERTQSSIGSGFRMKFVDPGVQMTFGLKRSRFSNFVFDVQDMRTRRGFGNGHPLTMNAKSLLLGGAAMVNLQFLFVVVQFQQSAHLASE
jgi:hypothetical protein